MTKDRKFQNYLVFQGRGNGASFCTQMDNRIIWAPKCNEWGNTFPYWERIRELQEGDKIFHAVAGHIVAVSVVVKAPTGETMPFPLDSKGFQLIPNLMGYFAKLDISVLPNPISYRGYKDEILDCRARSIGKGDFCDADDFPFTKYGGGQFGYLYHLPQELADLFLWNLFGVAGFPNNSAVRIGDTVVWHDLENNEDIAKQIVAKNVGVGEISCDAELAKESIGKEVGDIITVNKYKYKIKQIIR